MRYPTYLVAIVVLIRATQQLEAKDNVGSRPVAIVIDDGNEHETPLPNEDILGSPTARPTRVRLPTSPEASSTTTTPTKLSSTTVASPTTSTTSTTTTTTTATAAPFTTEKPTPVIPECPAKCTCTARLIDCSNLDLVALPTNISKSSFVEARFSNNLLTSIDLKMLPWATIETLDLSGNLISEIKGPKNSRQNELSKLRVLNLSDNRLKSLVGLVNSWRMPLLKEFKLADNAFEKINSSDFSSLTKSGQLDQIELLDLSDNLKLKNIDESSFSAMVNLKALNLSRTLGNFHLPDKIFANNQKLETLDLSQNDLVEVPVALRSTAGIKKLLLNENSLTSLRQSDFINRGALEHLEVSNCPRLLRVEPDTFVGLASLKTLIISNNAKFYDFSPNAFLSSNPAIKSRAQLLLLDLSNNLITTMSNPTSPPQVQVQQMRLAGNPWNCDCNLQWLTSMPNQIARQPIHCKTPFTYKDLEINQFFQTVDCQVEESSMQKFVLISFLLFLIVLTIAVFVQKTDICRRLQWRDQYGTIYYTKASFPTDKV